MNKKVRQISLTEYAEMLNLTKPGAHAKLLRGYNPGVKGYKKIGNSLVIEIYTEFERALKEKQK